MPSMKAWASVAWVESTAQEDNGIHAIQVIIRIKLNKAECLTLSSSVSCIRDKSPVYGTQTVRSWGDGYILYIINIKSIPHVR